MGMRIVTLMGIVTVPTEIEHQGADAIANYLATVDPGQKTRRPVSAADSEGGSNAE